MTTPREAAWQEFVDWCGGRGLAPMPANPWTVAAYIRFLERSTSPTAIQRVLRAIAREHRQKSRKRPERHPTVTRTLRGVEARAKERRQRRSQGPSLFPEEELVPGKAVGKVAGKRTARKAATAQSGKTKNGKTQNGKTQSGKAQNGKAKADKAKKAAAPPKPVRPMRHTPRLVAKRKLDG